MKTGYIQLLILCFSLLLSFTATSQIEPQFTNYMYTVQQFNPAFAGAVTNGSITGVIRSQWVGIEGAPESQFLSYLGPVSNGKMGVGLNLIHDKVGPSSYKSFSALYAYNLRINSTTTISLGINAGGSLLDIDLTEGDFENPGDIAQNNLNNEFYAKVGAGAMVYNRKWFAGFSVPNFFKQDFYDSEIRNVVANKLQFNVLAGYQFELNRNLTFRPSVLANIIEGNPITLNANANFLLFGRLHLGLGYRYNEALSGLAGFQILENLLVGYSYDYGTNDFSNYHDGSHEIVLKFKFKKQPYNAGNALNSF
ncbi:type IX secretion system membrane protein PorP/SprF [Zunongwangia sp. F363]|uniref:Type IX secretion system membrane protein PorP/SprF n=1 Tax=Autumnicola tepida TaxID=3075595 RepID=A0ABU3CF34_9FLAO|nr:type IX secretion system membrane protein PorP/SprF [Zunongwangia sp. F363]MDT0644961.1 type IX secretion system membrane protein PorP/SprF [Zunongwangia sp. F363]